MRSFRCVRFLVVTVVLMVIAPASALATDYFYAYGYPATITGSATETQTLTVEGLSVKCSSASYGGELPEPALAIEVTPVYGACTAGGLSATMAGEGCAFKLYANTTAVDLVCPAGKAITIAAVSGSCEIQIGAQSGLSAVAYTAVGSEPANLSVNLNLSGVKYKKVKDGLFCPLSGTGEGTSGTLSGSSLLKSQVGVLEVGLHLKPVAPTKLCKEDKASCPKGQEYTTGTELAGTSVNVEIILSSPLVTEVITCEAAGISGKTKADFGTPKLETSWDNAIFEDCVWPGAYGQGAKCSIGLTPSATVQILAIGGRNGDWGLGNSQLILACDLVGNKQCVYKAAPAKLELRGDKEEKATAVVDRTFNFSSSPEVGHKCLPQATWKGTYKITTPTEFYVTN